MVNMRASCPTPKDTNNRGDANILEEMRAGIDRLGCKNQTLEANVHDIRKHRQESNPLDKREVLDSQPLLDEIWEVLVLEGFKPPSLAKFDGHNDPYEHVTSINTHMVITRVPDSL